MNTDRCIRQVIHMSEKKGQISEQKASDQTMNDLLEIVENSFDGILVADGEGNVQFGNIAYERNTGIRLDDIVGRNIRDFINPVWMKTSIILLAIEQRKPVSMHHVTQNDKRIIVTGTPIFDEHNDIKRVVVNTRDISEIYHLQQELYSAKKMAESIREQSETEKGEEDDDSVVILNSRMRRIYDLTEKICNFNATVFITGESGVGKELVARSLHDKSIMRKDKKFVAVNCGAIPENLLESELFGYVEGAFTGAAKGGKVGLFEAANGGTVFLDEVGELSLNLQVKLLRALESRTITRVGSSEEIHLDINVVAATNRNLEKAVADGTFREDLYYRLNVISIEIPPLRERKDEIAPLAFKFVKQYNKQYGIDKKLKYEVIRELEEYDWPGNIRQLKNVIERMVVVSDGDYIEIPDLPWLASSDSSESYNEHLSLQSQLNEFEREILKKAKEKYGSSREIGKALKVDQSTIVRKLNKYKL